MTTMEDRFAAEFSLVVDISNFWATVTSNGSPDATGPLSCLPSMSVTLMYCGQMVGWIKMPLGTEVSLDPGNIVLDGDPALPQKGAQQLPLFDSCLLWPNGRPSQQLLDVEHFWSGDRKGIRQQLSPTICFGTSEGIKSPRNGP